MRHLIDSLRHLRFHQSFEREIAPGVRLQIRKPPVTIHLPGIAPFLGLTGRVHDAWDVLCGKAHASQMTLKERLPAQRRAA